MKYYVCSQCHLWFKVADNDKSICPVCGTTNVKRINKHEYELHQKQEDVLNGQILDFDSFVELYQPIKNPVTPDTAYDGYMFETYGGDVAYVEHYDPNYVWTVIEEGGKQFILPGIRLVNRFGYFITKRPWPNKEITFMGD